MASLHGTWRPSNRVYRERGEVVDGTAVKPEETAALNLLRTLLPAEEYEKMLGQWRRGEREIRCENGFIMTCLTPEQKIS